MHLPATFMIAACLLAAAAHAAPPVPTIFAPDSIAGDADDGAAAFTPDGATVYFMRGTDSFTLVESHRRGGRWSTPKAAPFSGRWRDLDPANRDGEIGGDGLVRIAGHEAAQNVDLAL